MTDASDVSNFKYHSAQVVALSSGRLAMVGPFSNEEGLPLVNIFNDFASLHQALWEFQNTPWKQKHTVRPQAQISLASLGLLPPTKPLTRRPLRG